MATSPVDAGTVEAWLAALELVPVDRSEREGIHSWDLVLDGQRRADIRLTLILEPSRTLLCWLHFAPPLSDSFRVSYHRFLRWNDELSFVKFAISVDERPMLTSELAAESLSRDALGSTIARLLAVCDATLDESGRWLWPGAKAAPAMDRPSRQAALFERYAGVVDEVAASLSADATGTSAATMPAAATEPDLA